MVSLVPFFYEISLFTFTQRLVTDFFPICVRQEVCLHIVNVLGWCYIESITSIDLQTNSWHCSNHLHLSVYPKRIQYLCIYALVYKARSCSSKHLLFPSLWSDHSMSAAVVSRNFLTDWDFFPLSTQKNFWRCFEGTHHIFLAISQ